MRDRERERDRMGWSLHGGVISVALLVMALWMGGGAVPESGTCQ